MIMSSYHNSLQGYTNYWVDQAMRQQQASSYISRNSITESDTHKRIKAAEDKKKKLKLLI